MPTTTAYELLRQTGCAGRVHLVPPAESRHPEGLEQRNDLWWVEMIETGIVRLHNTTTRHVVDLQLADVVLVEVDPDAPQDGLVYLRVHLARQLWLRGAEAGWVAPQRRIPRVRRQQYALSA